jgi:hypothetical protein
MIFVFTGGFSLYSIKKYKLILIWASRFAPSGLASGYPLHHLRALPLVGRYGGSAAIPLASRPLGASRYQVSRFALW